MSAPAVSVVIISYNRAADLRRALDSVRATHHEPLEIVVVDNASRDDSADVAESQPGVVVLRNRENLGFAAAVNLGLRRTRGEYVALLNNDAVLSPSWISELCDFLEHHREAAAAAGKMYFWDQDHEPGDRSGGYHGYSEIDPRTGHSHVRVGAPDRVREVATLSGAAVMVRRRAIEDVGLPFLEPAFFLYYEETDFFARAVRKGWRLYYTGEPAAWHRVRGSASSYTYHYYMERNRLLYAARNFSESAFRACVKATLRSAGSVILSARWLRRRDDELRARIDAWKWLWTRRGLLRESRRLAAAGRPFEEVVAAIQERAAGQGPETAREEPARP
jgi:hypothetical protein